MGRCCMDQVSTEFPHGPDALRSNVETAFGIWAACVEHSIENSCADSGFGLLTGEASRSETGTDNCLVSAHRGFNQSALAVVGILLPAHPSPCSDHKNVLVS